MRNKKEILFTIAIILFSIMAMVSCTNNKGSEIAAPAVSFSKDLIPIFTASCAINGSCHSGTKNTGDNMDFDSSVAYTTIITKDLINFNNLTASLLYVEISSGIMPKAPYDKLSSAKTNLILDWIKQGAKNN